MNSFPALKRFGRKPPPASSVRRPAWVARSPLLIRAYALAAEGHVEQSRASDGAPLLVHAIEVADLLQDADSDQSVVAAALLHDAVEHGTLSKDTVYAEMGARVADLVLALTEDPKISSFADRREALREQMEAAGSRAVTIFAAEVLCNGRTLRRSPGAEQEALAERRGTTIEGLVDDYRESVEMIERVEPGSVFVLSLRTELAELPGQLAVS